MKKSKRLLPKAQAGDTINPLKFFNDQIDRRSEELKKAQRKAYNEAVKKRAEAGTMQGIVNPDDAYKTPEQLKKEKEQALKRWREGSRRPINLPEPTEKEIAERGTPYKKGGATKSKKSNYGRKKR